MDHYEEIDDKYRKKQKKKLLSFILTLSMAVIFAVGGLTFNIVASNKATDTYQNLISEAAKTSDYDEKIKLYEECIAIPDKGGEKEAYLGLIQAYKDNDSVFTVDEAKQLEKLITNNKSALIQDPESYTEICFETAKLFWYYYNYGDGSDNQVTKAKSSIEWFEDVLDNAPDDYENIGMAKVYANVGIFYRDITTAITEASDKGKYQPLFENLSELIDTVAMDDKETEIVRLELLELSRSAIQQYATKFKNDGISQTELDSMLDNIEVIAKSIDTTTDLTDEKKASITEFIGEAREAVELAYGTNKGEN